MKDNMKDKKNFRKGKKGKEIKKIEANENRSSIDINEKGIELSFSFIFSLIIIAVVVFVAIWAIKHFLEIKDRTQIQMTIKDIENVVNQVWQAEETNRTVTFYLPKAVQKLCFFNKSAQQIQEINEITKYGNTNYNLFLIPHDVSIKYDLKGSYNISCGQINCLFIPQSICFENKKGEIKIRFIGKQGKVMIEDVR